MYLGWAHGMLFRDGTVLIVVDSSIGIEIITRCNVHERNKKQVSINWTVGIWCSGCFHGEKTIPFLSFYCLEKTTNAKKKKEIEITQRKEQ